MGEIHVFKIFLYCGDLTHLPILSIFKKAFLSTEKDLQVCL